MTVETGLDRVAAGDPAALALLSGRKLGLLAHPASVDRRLRHAHAVLLAAGCDVRALFGPEHGYGGEAQDMIAVGSERASSGLAVHSLYGGREEDLSPRAEWLDGLDAVVIDLQDVGSRYYTFVWTAVLMLRSAAAAGVQTIVLDRPNPLGGSRVCGGPQRAGYRSFVGLHDVAVQHGMTIAELCSLAADRERIDRAAWQVLPMRGYRRELAYEATGLPWVLPSPNMPTLDTARVYPGGCLLEGTNLSEGRGTTAPFQLVGAPFLDGPALAQSLMEAGAPGVMVRPVTFKPTFEKHAGKRCNGVMLHVTTPSLFRPVATYLTLITLARAQAPESFEFRSTPYEFEATIPAFDLLTGSAEARTAIAAGASAEDVVATTALVDPALREAVVAAEARAERAAI